MRNTPDMRVSQTNCLLTALVIAATACGSDNHVTPPPPPLQAQIKIAGGDGQTGPSFAALPLPLEIALNTVDGAPLANVPVQWTVTTGGGSLQQTSVLTDNAGHATASLTVGRSGTQSVDAAVSKFSVRATFSETAVIPTRVIALHYDGASWVTALSETNAAFPTANTVWGSSDSDVWIAGAKCDGPFITRYNGSSWSEVAGCQSSPAAHGFYSDIWGLSATDIWAVQWLFPDPHVAVVHYVGQALNPTVSTLVPGSVSAVWARSPNAVFVVGFDRIMQYDGNSWSSQQSPGNVPLQAIWGDPASNAVFAVGDQGSIVYYNGTSWQTQASGITARLHGVWGTSASDVFAVADNGAILHYDGTSWSTQLGGNGTPLFGIWGSSSNSIFAVGENTILHYDGTSWKAQNLPVPMKLNAVWGTSSTNVYAVGSGPTQ